MKKKGVAILFMLCIGMCGPGTVSSQAEERQSGNEIQEAQNENRTLEFQGEVVVDEENVSTVDKEGNVIFVDMSNDETLIDVNRKERTTSEQIVNLRKTSGVIEYKEVETGEGGYTAGSYGADAAYLGTNNGKVRFMLGGVIGEVQSSKVQIIAKSSAKSVSYYVVSGGRLYHYVSTNVNSSNYGSVLDNGPAPSYLKSGIKYYSYDGHYFYTEQKFDNMLDDYKNNRRTNSVNVNNPFYNYFQYFIIIFSICL